MDHIVKNYYIELTLIYCPSRFPGKYSFCRRIILTLQIQQLKEKDETHT